MREATCDFSASPVNVGAARRFVSETAERWSLGELAWPLVQIVSELASNAVIHAGTDFTVRLAQEGDTTRIEVVDHSARRAQTRGYDLDATTGRGLRLVDTLARDWGVSRKGKDKTVWAVVDALPFVDVDPDRLAELFVEGEIEPEPPAKPAKPRSRGSRTSKATAA